MRERCYHCFRPLTHCYCQTIPRIDNRTDVLILQHIGERYHPFNTARMVEKALRRCKLIVDHNQQFAGRQLPIQPDAGLLYPAVNAPTLDQLAPENRPRQLIIIDGTWHQAKTIVRDVPRLQTLPCYRLAPATPGQYRIRREPNDQSLSTVEATVAALSALEPETVGFSQLLSAFEKMVTDQIGHPATHAEWRRKASASTRPRNIPLALLEHPERLVVAYGEGTPGELGKRHRRPLPVNWVAQRFGSEERFHRCLQPPRPLTETELAHMRLSEEDFRFTVSPADFCRQWERFLRPNDVLVVYHQRTSQLLRHLGAVAPRSLTLKSIFGSWREGIPSLESLLIDEEIPLPAAKGKCRAMQRMEMAVAMVEHLRSRSVEDVS